MPRPAEPLASAIGVFRCEPTLRPDGHRPAHQGALSRWWQEPFWESLDRLEADPRGFWPYGRDVYGYRTDTD